MSRKTRIIWSASIALGFLVLYYFVSNLSFSVKGEKLLLRKVEAVRNVFWPRKTKENENVLFINVDYDREMRPVFDIKGDKLGERPYTDRHKLLRLLQFLQEVEYKYILLDVFFADDVKTEWDSALFTQIVSMPRIVIPCEAYEDEKLADESLRIKSGKVSYNESFWVYGFTIYPFYWGEEKSLPLMMYEKINEETTGSQLKKYGPFYFDGCRLAKGCDFLSLDVTANKIFYDDGNRCWYNLGSDILGDERDSSFVKLVNYPEMFKGKFIVIGSFQPDGKGDDMVSTFKGPMSGAVINYNAFCSLMDGHHKVSFGITLILYVLFFVVSFIMLGGGGEKEKLQKWADSKGKTWSVICFLLLPWAKSTLLLQLSFVVIYLVLDKVLPLFLISVAFYYLSLFVKLKNHIQQ